MIFREGAIVNANRYAKTAIRRKPASLQHANLFKNSTFVD